MVLATKRHLLFREEVVDNVFFFLGPVFMGQIGRKWCQEGFSCCVASKKGHIHQTTKTTGFWITNSLLKFLGVKKGAFHVWMHVSYMYHVPKMIHNDACRIPLEVVAVVFSLSFYSVFCSPLWVYRYNQNFRDE